MSENILVINANWIPINVTSKQRAITMLYLQKAQQVNESGSIVRLNHQIRRPIPEVYPSRKAIMARDSFTCQYCGTTSNDLTLDHVVPRCKGGKNTWDNLVCSCVVCNNKKDDKTPEEAGMKLLSKPRRPKCLPHMSYPKFVYAIGRKDWADFLEPYLAR